MASPVDLNLADLATLAALPGLGPTRAHAIVAHRNQHGRFASLADVDRVSGIGPASLAQLASRVSFGPYAAPSPLVSPTSDQARFPVVPSVRRLNPNSATSDELATWPGFSGLRAEAVVVERQRNGPYDSCQDLVRAEGVGPATVALVRDLCVVISPPPEGPDRLP